MVGMVRCAVPARVIAGGTNIRADTLAFEKVAPLHAARTSQRDVPTTLNTYSDGGEGEINELDAGLSGGLQSFFDLAPPFDNFRFIGLDQAVPGG